MKKYKSHKTVQAAKIACINKNEDGSAQLTFEGDAASVVVNKSYMDHRDPQEGGYYVRYEDGYESWSPAEAFEEGYCAITDGCLVGLPFGKAIEALRTGKRVTREGWNGKHMFLFLLPGGTVPKSAIHDPALLKVVDAEYDGDTFDALPSIRMWTADKKILTGWLASQTDMMALDWQILS